MQESSALSDMLPSRIPPEQPIVIANTKVQLNAPLTITLEGIPFSPMGRLRMIWQIIRGKRPRAQPALWITGNVFQNTFDPADATVRDWVVRGGRKRQRGTQPLITVEENDFSGDIWDYIEAHDATK